MHETIGTWLSVFLATASTLLLAWLIHRLIERPFGPKFKNAVLGGLALTGAPSRHTASHADKGNADRDDADSARADETPLAATTIN